MPRKAKLLNVKKHLEFEIWLVDVILEDVKKGRLVLAPFYTGALTEIRFFAKAILRKHQEKNTRKDIYVEVK
jgi:hypothetical protein